MHLASPRTLALRLIAYHSHAYAFSATQDNTILKTPSKVKTYLTQQQIDYDPASPPYLLRGKAKARMKKIAQAALSVEQRQASFKRGLAKSVTEMKEIIARVKNDGIEYKEFFDITFTFENVPFVVTTAKCTVLEPATGDTAAKNCNGKINQHSMCWKCKTQNGPHGVGYSFKAEIAQIEDDDQKITVTCAQGAGATMFGIEAIEWVALSDSEKLDKIEEISNVPMVAGITIAFDDMKQDLFLCIFDVKKVDA